jgi:HK97 family phage major capsid protein
MKKSLELKQERSAKIAEQSALVAKATTENRSLTTNENTQFDALQTEIDSLAGEITRAEQFEANQRSITGAPVDTSLGGGEQREMQKIVNTFSISKALRGTIDQNLDGAEAEINAIGQKELRENGRSHARGSFSIPSVMLRADAHTITEDSGANGGKLKVGDSVRFVNPLIPKLVLENLGATFLTGLSGDVVLPTATDFNFSWLAETATASSSKVGFDGPKLSPKRLAGVGLISNQLLMQSAVSADALIVSLMSEGIRRGFEDAAINGASGGNNPVGLLGMSGILAAAGTTDVVPTHALLAELRGLIDVENSTEENLGYLINPRLYALLETITKDAGSGRFLAENGLVAGYNTGKTSLVKKIAAAGQVPDLYPVIFGDFSQMFIGQFGAINVVVDPVSKADANSVKITMNMHGDVAVTNKKSFAKNTFFKL